MARDKMTYDSYERDIFDNPPKGPVGVHRGSRPLMARLAPFLVVMLIAALAGVGAWLFVSGEYKVILGQSTSQSETASDANSADSKDSSNTSANGSSNSTKKDSSSSDAKDSSSDSTQSDSTNSTNGTDQNTQQPEQTSTVNKATQVLVVNATGIQGYAGQRSDVLQTSGYTSVTAANPDGTLTMPTYTVVWYQNETDKATAEDVANTLGIATVEQAQGLAVPITVVLLN